MANQSQKNLIELARQAQAKGKLEQSAQYLGEALRSGYDQEAALQLVDVDLKLGQKQAAYALIKEEKDLFSDPKVFAKYLEVLAAMHYRIEFIQLEKLVGHELKAQVEPVPEDEQEKIMGAFKQLQHVKSDDYQKLYQLSEDNFVRFAQSCLLDPSCDFVVHSALTEDLVKMGVDQKINILVLGEPTSFNPSQTPLLSHDKVYRQVCSAIASSYSDNPSRLPLVLGEANFLLAAIYPELDKRVLDPEQFAHDLDNFIASRDGGANQELLEKAYKQLPKRR
jgi:hypothetical protein